MNIDEILGQLPDMTKAKTGGGSGTTYQAPPEGPVLLRLVSYIELGNHNETYLGEAKKVNKVQLVFELHGKNYPVTNGVPMRITCEETLSYHEKANFKKLFMSMRNGDESVKHPAQLVGRGFKGKVFHKKWNKDGQEKVIAQLRNTTGYSIGPAVAEDPETGETRAINVPTQVSPSKIFIWDHATKEAWDSLFIEGTYNDGNSKNRVQEKILAANNYKGSKLFGLLNGLEELPKPQSVELRPAPRYARNPRTVQASTPAVNLDFDDNIFDEGNE